jgi:GDP-mannose 6-dehydrogenase
MRISIFGLGYVGCVSAARLAEAGHHVMGVDINRDKVAMVNAGNSPIVEPGLQELLHDVTASGQLRATQLPDDAIARSDMALVCVGTPGYANGRLDLTALLRVCDDIGRALRGRRTEFTVVIRSTVLPGTTEKMLWPAILKGAGRDFRKSLLRIAVNPEFMREGTALADFKRPPLTLAGCRDEYTAKMLHELYRSVEAPLVNTSIQTAEMLKYVSNAFHALKICFSNEIAEICDAMGVDAQEVMRIFRMDSKLNISEAYLRPGFAFGGSCLPKDVRALTYAARDIPIPVLNAVMPSNEARIRHALETILATRSRRIGVVGLSFKPGTDDLRESPMVALVEALIGKGCRIRVLDHNITIARLTGANRKFIEEGIPHISSLMCESAAAILDHAEVVVIGNRSEEADAVLAGLHSDQIVIDLARGANWSVQSRNERKEKICHTPEIESAGVMPLSASPLLR